MAPMCATRHVVGGGIPGVGAQLDCIRRDLRLHQARAVREVDDASTEQCAEGQQA
eukprot:CAMPEP_0177452118 /NCGR_PEP_ID=MMETSP0369-20130122/10138_1 /TAXON_ID=447022 ORGANISM="Scrippsiella hangoei-like, Strain SHHI-4" /NCGR_SAMPLE_ID=MMETSP0369 /ASSEMBLY_ACC=CAM_ASM_000364 /LENGTH=54 /DNA_ID=CAMNT_0018924771 /DNA_START=15 /DNA_END=176 /DNA_ORIENTATION=+